MQEYAERKNKKMVGGILANEEPKFWLTSSRPSNFGDHLDVKTKVDNWFDENRVWNEENKDYELRRAQIYMMQGLILSFLTITVKGIVTVVYH